MRPRIGVSVAESVPAPTRHPRPPSGAPNVVVVVLDDTGFAQLGCYGSDIRTPNIDGLARSGILYNRFHVTALCSPTRACLLTGRNHHAVGMGFLADIPMAFPGYTARIPKSAATLARVLADAGYSTLAVGKWHLTPRGERTASGPFCTWPLGLGFERFYGFLHGDANQWTPNLVSDNHFVDPPARPEDGYHLTEDLVDTSVRLVRDQQQATPGKPFFLYLATGATHAPHHVPAEWAEAYRGSFDDGWERWRERTFERQMASGVVPPGTVLTERPPWVQAWDHLPAEERRLYARMQEIFAGFLTHTDHHLGRLFGFLAEIGAMDHTLVVLLSDNGASAEGGRVGSVNEHRFGFGVEEDLRENLARVGELGGFRAYNHYPWGWAWAGNTPLRLWKRYTWLGGTRTPMLLRWPAGTASRGAVRSQFCHAVDLMPTVLDACGIEVPENVDGVAQQPLDGASLRPTFDDPEAPTRGTQYFEMMGSRSIYHDGWKATTDHVPRGVIDEERFVEGSRDLAADRWMLFRLEDDFSESRDLASERPAKLAELEALWWAEAGRNGVLPLEDSMMGRFGAFDPPAYPPGRRCVLRPGGAPVADESVPSLAGGGRVTAEVVVPPGGAEGIICAQGDWSNGWALLALHGRLVYVLNAFGTVHRVEAEEDLPPGPASVGLEAVPDGSGGAEIVLLSGSRRIGTGGVPGGLAFSGMQIGGGGLTIGRDRGFPVCDDYEPPFEWTGELLEVVLDTGGGPGRRRPGPSEVSRALRHE
jgi:arylsulfatase A-like enzyme